MIKNEFLFWSAFPLFHKTSCIGGLFFSHQVEEIVFKYFIIFLRGTVIRNFRNCRAIVQVQFFQFILFYFFFNANSCVMQWQIVGNALPAKGPLCGWCKEQKPKCQNVDNVPGCGLMFNAAVPLHVWHRIYMWNLASVAHFCIHFNDWIWG